MSQEELQQLSQSLIHLRSAIEHWLSITWSNPIADGITQELRALRDAKIVEYANNGGDVWHPIV